MKHSVGRWAKIDENIAEKHVKISFYLEQPGNYADGKPKQKVGIFPITWKSKYISWIFKTIRNLGNRWLRVRLEHLYTGGDSSVIVRTFQESHFAPQFRKKSLKWDQFIKKYT